MIRLAMPSEPFWLDFGSGVRFKVRPPSTALMETARSRVRRELNELRKAAETVKQVGATVTGMADLTNADVFDGEFNALLAREMCRLALVEWDGVMMPDGSPAPISDETIGMAMNIDALARAFTVLYLTSLESLAAEGNGSAPVPSGSSAAGATTATAAE